MLGKLIDWDETICALSTPPGIGAIGVIRVSGPQTFQIVNKLFQSKDLSLQPSHTMHVGLLKSNGELLDEVVVAIFKNPNSFTGEDVAEISAHGSPYILEKILVALVEAGCRMAKPGEFTQRAFLHGKLDLVQAESIADLIASQSAAAHQVALRNLRGGFSKQLSIMRESLIQFSALLELELDFSEEDVAFADRSSLLTLIDGIENTTHALLKSFSLGNVIKNGVQVAIIGKPNAGKSTLLNALLNENRAIVSEIAGTTRDTIEETLAMDGLLFRFIDTAGLRNDSQDPIERIGVGKSLEKMHNADLVLYLFDIHNASISEIQEVANDLTSKDIRFLLVANKCDTVSLSEQSVFGGLPSIVFISAKAGQNLPLLRKTIVDLFTNGSIDTGSTIVTGAHHREALQRLSSSLQDIRAGLNENLAGDLLSTDVRQALHYLGSITGEVSNEDRLDYIFSKFCIGK